MRQTFVTAATMLLVSHTALAQQLNSWSQTVFSIGGSADHPGELAVDGDMTTYSESTEVPSYHALLMNRGSSFLGLYIQSSGDFITDYHVDAINWGFTGGSITRGRVCGATSNFTLVLFEPWPEQSGPGIVTDSLFINVTGALGNTAIINEVYPIFVGDTIFYPNNTSPCPPEASVPPPPPPFTLPPTPAIPGHPEVTPSRWMPSNKPIPVGGTVANSAALVDYNTTTYWSGGSNENPASFSLLFNFKESYQGLYVQSVPGEGHFITDYSITTDGVAKVVEVYPIYAGDLLVEPA
ncbi:hypothetical protein B0H66DRAFT_515325 [Apodospora peruviana]|uniref:Uncharacterized protein n=1 Tax=Apodospora peruviana TaxID=516989 RepID=A0AAE0ICY7_9PEZI|nr:hypothetical protein B0H66DRAFT_515325 [Apodospora peruviana]